MCKSKTNIFQQRIWRIHFKSKTKLSKNRNMKCFWGWRIIQTCEKLSIYMYLLVFTSWNEPILCPSFVYSQHCQYLYFKLKLLHQNQSNINRVENKVFQNIAGLMCIQFVQLKMIIHRVYKFNISGNHKTLMTKTMFTKKNLNSNKTDLFQGPVT